MPRRRTARPRSRPRSAAARRRPRSTSSGMDQPFDVELSQSRRAGPVARPAATRAPATGRWPARRASSSRCAATIREADYSATSRGRPAAGGRARRSGPQPAADQADRRDAAQGRRAVRASTRSSTASWPTGSPPARRRRKPTTRGSTQLEILPARVGAQAGRSAAVHRPRPLQRRPRRRRHPLGQVHVDQRVGRHGRRLPAWCTWSGTAKGRQRLVREQDRRSPRSPSPLRKRRLGRRVCRRRRGATSSTSWCWPSWRA